MADIFSRRANASESSWSRDEDKARMLRLREFLRKQGYTIPEKKSAEAEGPSVDVLAEISAHSVPLGRVGAEHAAPSVYREVSPEAPDKRKLAYLPPQPSQSAVSAEIYQAHLGKGKWVNAVTNALEPRQPGGPAVNIGPSALFGRAPSIRDAAKLEREAAATAGAAGAIVVGTVLCVAGATLAGVGLWRWKGRPGPVELTDSVLAHNQERRRALEAGPVGQSVKVIAQTATATIPEHKGLQEWQGALKGQFNPQAKRGGGAGSAAAGAVP